MHACCWPLKCDLEVSLLTHQKRSAQKRAASQPPLLSWQPVEAVSNVHP